MMIGIVCCLGLFAGQSAEARGTIAGVVLDGSSGNRPLVDADVVLCIDDHGHRVPVAEVRTDAAGEFRFDELPLGEELQFLPGANRDGVHYPGARIELSPRAPSANVRIVAYGAVMEPSPLVVRRHDIVVRAEQGALHVSESLLVANPSDRAFVGQSMSDMPPVTLRLSIPDDFEKVTFQQEFFGRQFQVVNGKLLTSIPWTPGERTLEFTYVIPIAQRSRVLQRRIDLATHELTLRISGAEASEITSNLPRQTTDRRGELLFVSGRHLTAGQLVEVQLGKLPVPFIVYAKWIAVAILGVFIALAAARMRSDAGKVAAISSTPDSGPTDSGKSTSSQPRRRHSSRRAA